MDFNAPRCGTAKLPISVAWKNPLLVRRAVLQKSFFIKGFFFALMMKLYCRKS